jgi:hypothetical protein
MNMQITCREHGGIKKYIYTVLAGKCHGNRSPNDHLPVYGRILLQFILREMCCEDENWIQLAHDIVQYKHAIIQTLRLSCLADDAVRTGFHPSCPL